MEYGDALSRLFSEGPLVLLMAVGVYYLIKQNKLIGDSLSLMQDKAIGELEKRADECDKDREVIKTELRHLHEEFRKHLVMANPVLRKNLE